MSEFRIGQEVTVTLTGVIKHVCLSYEGIRFGFTDADGEYQEIEVGKCLVKVIDNPHTDPPGTVRKDPNQLYIKTGDATSDIPWVGTLEGARYSNYAMTNNCPVVGTMEDLI